MAKSKTDPKRKKKLQNFKTKQKKMSEQQQVQKTHLVPETEWQSKDILDLRGDLLEALEQTYVETYKHLMAANESFSKGGQVMQMILSTNIKAGKVKLNYRWNNGEAATEAEVKAWEDQMKALRAQQQQQVEEVLAQQNAQKTGLVAPDGRPIGTTQDLDAPEENEEVDGEEGVSKDGNE